MILFWNLVVIVLTILCFNAIFIAALILLAFFVTKDNTIVATYRKKTNWCL
jgi:hypothetical protein